MSAHDPLPPLPLPLPPRPLPLPLPRPRPLCGCTLFLMGRLRAPTRRVIVRALLGWDQFQVESYLL